MTATTAAAIPTLQDGVSPTAEATVLAGAPYSITGLNAGKVFWNNEKEQTPSCRREFLLSPFR